MATITMAYQIVLCKYCNGSEVVRYGTQSGRSRFRCKDCGRIFKTDYVYRAYEPGVKEQIVDIAMNGGGIRDTARILGIGKSTVISTLKKKSAEVVTVNPYVGSREIAVEIRHLIDPPVNVQADEQRATSATKRTSVGFGMPSMPRRDASCRLSWAPAKTLSSKSSMTISRLSTSKFIIPTTGAVIQNISRLKSM
jgi:transposase